MMNIQIDSISSSFAFPATTSKNRQAAVGDAVLPVADKVTISPEAQAKLASSRSAVATTDASLQYREISLRDAQANPMDARKMAYDYAYDTSYETHGPMVDISQDPIRYSGTGEIVTDSNLAEFKNEAAKVTAGRIALYQAEKAMGTPDAEILDKLFSYTDTQSDSYLSKLNWTRKSA